VIRKLLWPFLASIVVAGVTASIALATNGDRNNKTFVYTIGLWGDLRRPKGW
jgi:hypothetical protein